METITTDLEKITITTTPTYIFNQQLSDEEEKYIKDQTEKIKKYENILRDKNMVETGSYFGLFSIFLSQFANTVYCFEPDRLLFNQLCGNIYINKIENILPFNYGLDQIEGKTTMIRYLSDQKESEKLNEIKEPVYLQTLDSFQVKNIGLIILNTNELNTILGSLKTLYDNNFPVIMVNKDVSSNNERYKGLYQVLHNLEYSYIEDGDFVVFTRKI